MASKKGQLWSKLDGEREQEWQCYIQAVSQCYVFLKLDGHLRLVLLLIACQTFIDFFFVLELQIIIQKLL